MKEKFLKLTNTVYKVLEYFPESDPLKTRAKDKALAIMSALIGRDLAPGREQSICDDIDILLGYLWIGRSQGWLNSVNFLIVANEYEKIKNEFKPVAQEIPEVSQKLPGIESKPEIMANEPKSGQITERQKKILDFLSKNNSGQVMDFQTILPDVTKRTIRRDVDELLETGKIIRLGDFNKVFYKINGFMES